MPKAASATASSPGSRATTGCTSTSPRRCSRGSRLIGEYFTTVEELLTALAPGNHALAVEIASVPERIRGFGHVKQAHLARARARHTELLERWRTGGAPLRSAA